MVEKSLKEALFVFFVVDIHNSYIYIYLFIYLIDKYQYITGQEEKIMRLGKHRMEIFYTKFFICINKRNSLRMATCKFVILATGSKGSST